MARAPRPRTVEVVEQFITSRRAGGCSARTEESLRYHLRPLLQLFVELPLTPEAVETALAVRRHLAYATRKGTWNAMRMLFLWASARLGVADAARLVRPPRETQRGVRRTMTREDVGHVLFANQLLLREHAMLRLLLDTGARVGEVHNLTWKDLEREGDACSVVLRGKTGERRVPVSPRTFHLLSELGEGGVLWRGRRGPLTLAGVQRVVHRALLRGGVDGGPHLLRHTFGRLFIVNGGSVFALQRIMGHSSIATTRMYVDLDLGEVRQEHARFSPLAVVGKGEPAVQETLPWLGVVQGGASG